MTPCMQITAVLRATVPGLALEATLPEAVVKVRAVIVPVVLRWNIQLPLKALE